MQPKYYREETTARTYTRVLLDVRAREKKLISEKHERVLFHLPFLPIPCRERNLLAAEMNIHTVSFSM